MNDSNYFTNSMGHNNTGMGHNIAENVTVNGSNGFYLSSGKAHSGNGFNKMNDSNYFTNSSGHNNTGMGQNITAYDSNKLFQKLPLLRR